MKFDAIGGMQTQIYRQTIGLSKQGIEQTIVTLRIGDAEPMWTIGPTVAIRGVRIPVFPVRSRIRGMKDLNLSWALGVLWTLVRNQERFDLIHAHGSGVFWPLLIGSMARKILRAPLVITLHCSIHATYHPMNFLDRLMQPFARAVERRAIQDAARVIVLTERSREQYLDLGIESADRFSVVPDGIDVDKFRALGTADHGNDFERRFNIPKGKKLITFLGRIAREKGWPHFLSLADRMRDPEFHFLVCGDGNERDELEAKISARGLSPRFTITGFIPLEQVPAALARSSVMVLPSVHEEFGGAILEAMAIGVPVVAFNVGGIPEVLAQGRAGRIIPYGDVDAMANATRQIALDRSVAAGLISEGLNHVRSRFSLDACCSDVRRIYEELTHKEAAGDCDG